MNEHGRSEQLTTLRRAARAGKEAIERIGRAGLSSNQVRRKDNRSLVTDADMAANDAIIEELQAEFSSLHIISEETSPDIDPSDRHDYTALIDPLDGTTNFVRGLPLSAVSIGLLKSGRPCCGVVLHVFEDIEYYAAVGRGAFKQTSAGVTQLRVPERTLEEAIITMGYAGESTRSMNLWHKWTNALSPPVANRIRISECAALELCWVAEGVFDAYLHPSDNPWDMAAGGLIITEAGGRVVAPDGQPWQPLREGIIAAGGPLVDAILEALKKKGD